jgi:hypothetical protein
MIGMSNVWPSPSSQKPVSTGQHSKLMNSGVGNDVVGSLEGNDVGNAEGTTLGLDDRWCEGDSLGLDVNDSLGEIVGDVLGFFVGENDGEEDGLVEGWLLG